MAAVVRKDPAVDFRTATVSALEGMSDLVEEPLLIAAATSAEDWTNRICYLPV